jgi:hypothetical protein
VVWAAASLVTALAVAGLGPQLRGTIAAPPPPGRFDAWFVAGCEAAALVAGGWLWLLVTLVTLEAAGRAPRRRGVPRGLRRLVLSACGVGLVGGLVAPAYAAAPTPPLEGLPLPDRATSGSVADHHGSASPAPVAGARPDDERSAGSVRVVRGDTLWALAAAGLPGDAPLAVVDERWRAIHAANRDVIGADPDLILPGQQLRLPPAPPPAT